jgi:hypothetical protein
MTQTVREIDVTELGAQVEHALSEAVHHLPPDYLEALQAAYHNEDFEPARDIIGMLLENAEYAAFEQMRLPRFGRVREEKSGKLYRGGYHGQSTTRVIRRNSNKRQSSL